jgi:hypothetical protein
MANIFAQRSRLGARGRQRCRASVVTSRRGTSKLTRRWDKCKMPSGHVTVGPGRAPRRSYYYAMGLTEDEINQPFVGVAPRSGNTPNWSVRPIWALSPTPARKPNPLLRGHLRPAFFPSCRRSSASTASGPVPAQASISACVSCSDQTKVAASPGSAGLR